MVINELEQLKQLVLNGGFDEESRQEVLQLEVRLQKLATAERIAELPTIKEFISHLETLRKQADSLLRHDRSLTDRERDKLFERIDLCDHFTSLFTGKAKEQVEAEINELLDAAKNS
jgi:hydrogenase maturation factor HypF (carbamoyltransferase family)